MQEIVSVRSALEESLRLLDERMGLETGPRASGALAQLAALREELRGGAVQGALWVGPKDDGAGLSLWQVVPSFGRRVVLLYLAEGYRKPKVLGSFLDRLEALPGEAPLVVMPEEVYGILPSEAGHGLAERGFARHLRPAMRRGTSELPPRPPNWPSSLRLEPVAETDLSEIADLYAVAFAGSVDRFWFDHGDLAVDAKALLRSLKSDAWWPWLRAASLCARDGSSLLGASLVVEPPGRCPLLLELMVAPSHRRHGVGRALLGSTLEKLSELGHRELELNVIRENAPAFQLYASMGFRIVEGTEEAFWTREPPPGAARAR